MKYSIERFLNVKSASAPRIRAGRRSVFFLTDITGMNQVWEVGLPDPGGKPGWPEQKTFAPDRVMEFQTSRRPGSGDFIYGTDVGGNENLQLILAREDGAESTITTGFENVMHIPGEWAPGESRLLFAANRRRPDRFDLYIHEINGESTLVYLNDEPGYLMSSKFSPDGIKAVCIHHRSSFDQDIVEIDLASGSACILTPNARGVRYQDFDFTGDGRLIVLTDHDSDFLYLGMLDLDTLELERFVERPWDVEMMEISESKRTLLYSTNENGASRIVRVALESGQENTVDVPHPSVVVGADLSSDDAEIVLALTSPVRTGDLFLWNVDDSVLTPITRSSHGGITPDEFVSPSHVSYPTFDSDEEGAQRTIPGWMYKTKESDRAPVVVAVHGGPEGQSRPVFNGLTQFFVHAGYSVFVPNVRGSTGYGKTYGHLDDVEKRMDSVADLAHAARWLKSRADVDPERIVVFGGSYGGFMVLSSLTTYPDEWAAGIDLVGISSFVTFLENTSGYRRAHREAEYGSLANDREFLESISPINHIDNARAPLMVIHGENDPRVPVSEARQLVTALRERDVPVELLTFDDEGHGLAKLKNRLIAYPKVVDFLDRYLHRD